MRIPETPEQVNAAWLEHALQRAFPGVAIEGTTVLHTIHGSATKLRLKPSYARNARNLGPESLWVKIGLEPHSDFVRSMGYYDVEASCYETLIPELGLPAPTCFYVQNQPDPAQVVLVLEDLCLRNARFGLATKPLSLEDALSGVQALAQIHSKMWKVGKPARGLKPVLTWGELHSLNEFVGNAERYFSVPRGFAVPVALHDKSRLEKAWSRYKEAVLEGDLCLLHGDTHVGNTFITPDGTLSFLDWQCASIGHWSHDVSYFLITALDVPDRRKHERTLLAAYLQALKAAGVAPPDEDEAWRAYRRAIIFAFVVWLGNGDEFQEPEINLACFARAGTAMIDHDVFDLLGV